MDKKINISPSGADRWSRCGFSTRMDVFKEDSPAADRGSRIHFIASSCMENNTNPIDTLGSEFKRPTREGEIDCFMADDDMVPEAQAYVDCLRGLIKENTKWAVEVKLDLSKWIKNGSGTSDFYALDEEEGILRIADLKTGRSEVSAVENSQLQLYALGVYELLGRPDCVKEIELCIYQSCPFIRSDSTWSTTPERLAIFGEFIKDRAKAALAEDPAKIAGPIQCEWCAGRHLCSANIDRINKPVVEAYYANKDKQDDFSLPLEHRLFFLDNATKLDKLVKKINEETVKDFENGSLVLPDYELTRGNEKRNWNKDGEEYLKNKEGEDAYEKKLVSFPNYLKKKGLKKEDIDEKYYDVSYNKSTLNKIKKKDK